MSVQSKPVQQLTPFGAALAGALGGCFSTAYVPVVTNKLSSLVDKDTLQSRVSVGRVCIQAPAPYIVVVIDTDYLQC